MTLATVLIVGEGCVVLTFLWFVRSFGAFAQAQRDVAKALLDTHEVNLLVHQRNLQVLEELRGIKKLRPSVDAHEGQPELTIEKEVA